VKLTHPSSVKVKNGGAIHLLSLTSSWCGASLIDFRPMYLTASQINTLFFLMLGD
jgi:hypothetical protein